VSYPPPSVPVFAAGSAPTPVVMEALIQAPLGFLTGGITFRAHQATSQSLTAAGYTLLHYDTVDEDPYGGWSSVATSAQPAWSWLAPYTGWYDLTFGFSFTPVTASTWAGVQVLVSGNAATALGEGTSYGGASGSYVIGMAGGVDYVQFEAYVAASGLSTSVASAGVWSTAEITYTGS
jgi:hypothetical protein